MGTMDRRSFVSGAAAGLALLAAGGRARAQPEAVRLALLGCGRQGMALLGRLLGTPGASVVAVCDVDQAKRAAAAQAVEAELGVAPVVEGDLRRLLELDAVEAVVIALPNHWHAVACIWACQAGRDVYLETPACWSYAEGEAMLAARGDRIVQVGHELRGEAGLRDAVARARAGQVGPLYMARGICYELRDAIATQPTGDPPPGLDWNLWCGPAPRVPFCSVYLDGGWHAFWSFGGGEMGRQAVHQVDTARWFLDQTLPVSLFSSGGRYLAGDDMGETPNVQHTTFTFADGLPIVMEVRGRPSNAEAGVKTGNLVYGNQGYMAADDGYQPHIGYRGDGQPPEQLALGPVGGAGGDALANWLGAVRSRRREDLNCELEQGVRSAQLCCLANVSYRLLRALEFDPAAGRFVGDDEANALLARPETAEGFTW